MSYVSNIKIERKVAALLIMLGLVTVGVAISGYRTINSVDEQYTALSDVMLPATTDLVRTNRRAVELVHAGYVALVYEGNTSQAQNAAVANKVAYEAGQKNLDQAIETDPGLAEQMPQLRALFEAVHTTSARAIQLAGANRVDEARRVLRQGDEQLEELSQAYSTLNKGRVAESDRQTDELAEHADSSAFWTLVVSLLGVVGGVVMAVLAARAFIVAPLSRLQDTMRSLAEGNNKVEVAGVERGDEVGAMAKTVLVFRDAAIAQEKAAAEKAKADADQKFVVDTVSENLASLSNGDLTADIQAEFPPSYEELRTNFNSALANLRELIGSVTESAASLLTGSQEIAQASEDLARRTESNAASLEETSAAISQIDERLKASAVSAGRTVERADGAIATVTGGRGLAEEAVQAMGRVSESAKGIDSVIEGLDKIAFQTRVLAMNAAVEAGRAGEAGRGFAVVADLVGALAMRSEEEAKRAREQLTATQSDVIMAVGAVEKVDAALQNISGDVGQVHELLATMATDNQAQSSAITQIASAVGSMDQATQQNAAMVEQTSAAARNLSTEVTALSDQASAFNVGKSDRAPARSSNKAVKKASLSGSMPATYRSPVKSLSAATIPTTAANGDWQQF